MSEENMSPLGDWSQPPSGLTWWDGGHGKLSPAPDPAMPPAAESEVEPALPEPVAVPESPAEDCGDKDCCGEPDDCVKPVEPPVEPVEPVDEDKPTADNIPNQKLHKMAAMVRKRQMLPSIKQAIELLKNDQKLFDEVYHSRSWH